MEAVEEFPNLCIQSETSASTPAIAPTNTSCCSATSRKSTAGSARISCSPTHCAKSETELVSFAAVILIVVNASLQITAAKETIQRDLERRRIKTHRKNSRLKYKGLRYVEIFSKTSLSLSVPFMFIPYSFSVPFWDFVGLD